MVTISVIVPIYNGEQYIENCVDELSRQTLNNFEIILIDDGSTDKTLEILQRIKIKYENVMVYTKKNGGAGTARNYGIEKARGEYIAFLDVDDKYANEHVLKILYQTAKKNNALICGGSLEFQTTDLQNQNKKHIFESEGYMDFKEYQFDYGFFRFIYSKKLIKEYDVRFPNFKVYEDPVFMVKAMIIAGGFYAVTDPVYVYSGSHQKDLSLEKSIDYLKGLASNLRISAENNLGELHKNNFERLIGTGCYYAERNLLSKNVELFYSLWQANMSIDVNLLKKQGIQVDEPYIIPALNTIWETSCKYQKLRKLLWFK